MGSTHGMVARSAEVRRVLLRAPDGPSLAREWDLEWPTCEARALAAEVSSREAALAHQVRIVAALATIARDSAETFPNETATLDFWHELLLRDSASARRSLEALEETTVNADTALLAFREAQQEVGPVHLPETDDITAE